MASTSTMFTSLTTGASSADSFSSKTSTLPPNSSSASTSTSPRSLLSSVSTSVMDGAGGPDCAWTWACTFGPLKCPSVGTPPCPP